MLLTVISPAIVGLSSAAVQLPFSPEPEVTYGYIYPVATVVMVVQSVILFYRKASIENRNWQKWTKIVSFAILPIIVIILMLIELSDSTKDINRCQQTYTITIQLMLCLIFGYQRLVLFWKKRNGQNHDGDATMDSGYELSTLETARQPVVNTETNLRTIESGKGGEAGGAIVPQEPENPVERK